MSLVKWLVDYGKATENNPEYISVTKKSTVPRVGAGFLIGGIPGALVGGAFRKKRKTKIYKT